MATNPAFEPLEVPIDDLLLDPDNFRFRDQEGYQATDPNRIHETRVQTRAYERLKAEGEGLTALKKSISKSGYIPCERLIVRRYSAATEKYVVMEGNRRLAACKWILEDYATGIPYPEDVLSSLRILPVLVVKGDPSDVEMLTNALMGIRHVSGIKPWGGYQSAMLVAHMRERQNLPAHEVAERLGMSTADANKRYRAFKALEQMQNDEDFGEFARPDMYHLFYEALSGPIIKDWLKWSDDTWSFTERDELQRFYALITPARLEDGTLGRARISTYTDVRELRTILRNPNAKKRLFDDPDCSLAELAAYCKQDEWSRGWVGAVNSAIDSLRSMRVDELMNLSKDDEALLMQLKQLVEERLRNSAALKPQVGDA